MGLYKHLLHRFNVRRLRDGLGNIIRDKGIVATLAGIPPVKELEFPDILEDPLGPKEKTKAAKAPKAPSAPAMRSGRGRGTGGHGGH